MTVSDCNNCHQIGPLEAVKVEGRKSEEWCDFCIDTGAVKCDKCFEVVDIKAAFEITKGLAKGSTYICADCPVVWALGLRYDAIMRPLLDLVDELTTS